MVIALIVVGLIALLALLAAATALRRSGPVLTGRTVIVHTRRPDDRTLKGVVHARYADSWILRDAVLVQPGGREQALGGIQHLPRESVSWFQEVEA